MIKKKYQLDHFQQEACDYIDAGINILVSAPTGSGKTAIAEYSIEKTKEKDPKSIIVYTCPIKSLCNEKYHDMVLSYESYNKELGTNYQIGLMTGDIIINPESDILIMTTEVLFNLIMTKKDFEPKCVIFDEAHYINDDSRGHIWEKCIISSLINWDCYLTLLSATIGNIEVMINWLNSINSKKIFCPVIKTERPVPLKEWVIYHDKILPMEATNYDQTVSYWKSQYKNKYSVKHELDKICKIIEITDQDDGELELWFGMPVIFFVLNKSKCIELAEMVQSSYVTYEENNLILSFFDNNLKEFSNCSQFINLRKVIGKGIAYHHSGLLPKIREVIEFLIKRKLIKIIFATETFAVGLNFPVKTVVMTSLTKPTETGFRNLLVSEYKQMAGRAGRRFIDTVGHVIFWFYPYSGLKDPYPPWSIVNTILNGNVNGIESKYLIDPNYMIKTIGTNKSRILTDKSFKFFNDNREIKDISSSIPDKFRGLYTIELKMRDFASQGINWVDKTYRKQLQKLSKSDLELWKKISQEIFSHKKSEYELFIEWENTIGQFLLTNKLIELNKDTKENPYKLTDKGELACGFNEINPVLFANEYEKILESKELILPILSLFIDDGKIIDVISDDHINYWDTLIHSKYSKFIGNCPKWNFYPINYFILKDWLEKPTKSLDEVVDEWGIDMGMFVKILIKMYQISDELINSLEKLNRSDIIKYIHEQKELLIRYPLQITSLYVK
jgi:superfamily II DNA/RNA helicase